MEGNGRRDQFGVAAAAINPRGVMPSPLVTSLLSVLFFITPGNPPYFILTLLFRYSLSIKRILGDRKHAIWFY
jgi:hypothetical protein